MLFRTLRYALNQILLKSITSCQLTKTRTEPVFNYLQAMFRLNKLLLWSIHRDSLHPLCVPVEIWPPYTQQRPSKHLGTTPAAMAIGQERVISTSTLPRHRNRVRFVTLHQIFWFRRSNHLFIETWPRGGRQERKSADELWKEAGIKANGEGEISHLSLCAWIANLPLFKTLP